MELTIVGSGYVGTTVAACLADAGHRVQALDIDASIVARINAGESPIVEPGLEELIAAHAGDRLVATSDYANLPTGNLTMLSIQTPTHDDGRIDVGPLAGAIESVGARLAEVLGPDDRHLVVIKSTVVPPALETLRTALAKGFGDASGTVELATNPEFQREGHAVEDFRSPQKIVLGVESSWAETLLRELYQPIIDAADPVVIVTDPPTAAMIKYANNAFLAAKISLINDIGNACKAFGVDAYEVADAIGTDDRIGARFLRSGVGFGGSCFPKDVKALQGAARDAGYNPMMLEAALAVNEHQPRRLVELLAERIELADARVAVLGLAFKPGTDDIRNSRAIPVIERLREAGATVVGYDPVATTNMRSRFPDIEYTDTASEALDGADGAVVVTDWDEFAALDDAFDAMPDPVVVDGRRVIERRDGIEYVGLTW